MVWAIHYDDVLSLDNNEFFRFIKAKSLMLLFCLNRKMPMRAALSLFITLKHRHPFRQQKLGTNTKLMREPEALKAN